jgi:hypothetical protein
LFFFNVVVFIIIIIIIIIEKKWETGRRGRRERELVVQP